MDNENYKEQLAQQIMELLNDDAEGKYFENGYIEHLMQEYEKIVEIENTLWAKVKTRLKGVKTVKDYRSMCQLLDEPEKKNKEYKEEQIALWRECFSFKMDGRKFTRIKILSDDEHDSLVLKRKFSNNAFYTFCVFLYQYCLRDTDLKGYNSVYYGTTHDIALAIGYINSAFKYYRWNKEDYANQIENNILLERIDKKPFLKDKRDEIKKGRVAELEDGQKVTFENLAKINHFEKSTLSKVSKDIDYQVYSYQRKVDEIFDTLSKDESFVCQDGYIGLFISSSVPKEYYSKIYRKDNKFYYDIDGTTFQVTYEERPLNMNTEFPIYFNLRWQALENLNLTRESLYGHYEEYNQEMMFLLLKNLGVLSVYKTHVVIFSKLALKKQLESYSPALLGTLSNPDFYGIQVKQNIEKSNEDSITVFKQHSENTEKKRSPDNIFDKSLKSKVSVQSKTTDFMNRQMISDLIAINAKSIFPDGITVENFNDYENTVWKKLFSESDKKIGNYLKVYKTL